MKMEFIWDMNSIKNNKKEGINMKFCISCGSELQENVAFCTNCGTNVNEMTASQETAPTSEQPNSGTQTTQLNDSLDKLKNLNYFKFLKETAINPTTDTDSTGYNGWIQLGLLTLFTTLTFVNISNSLVRAFTASLGGFFSGDAQIAGRNLISSVAPRIFFITFIIYALFIFAAYFSQKLASKNSNIRVTPFVNQYSGLLTPNLILVVAATLLALMANETTIQLALILVGLSFLLMVVAYTYYMYSNINFEEMDRFNVIVIGNVAVFTIVAIIINSQIQPLITMFGEVIHYLF